MDVLNVNQVKLVKYAIDQQIGIYKTILFVIVIKDIIMPNHKSVNLAHKDANNAKKNHLVILATKKDIMKKI